MNQNTRHKLKASDINWAVSFLFENLPKKPTKSNYQQTYKMLYSKNRNQTLLQRLQKICDSMCDHLLIKKHIKIILLDNIDSGKFEITDGLACIFINGNTDRYRFKQVVGILAHEVTHYYLIQQHSLILMKEIENELITDIAAVYLGFGFLLLSGYKDYRRKAHGLIITSHVGYIYPINVCEAIIQTAYIRKQKPQWILKHVGVPYIFIMIFRLRRLYILYLGSK